jgi:menaquinone-9 beta-reductase
MKADVLILGGGPAGGMAAWRFATAGLSVVLCEAHAQLPHRVCGMYLCPAGVAMLDRFGIRESVAPDGRRLVGMVMVAPSLQRLETFFPHEDGIPSHGLVVRRPQFDTGLLDAAQKAGAKVRMGERPQSVTRTPAGWLATLPAGDTIEARLLVGADGRKSSTARLLGLSLPVRRSRTAIHIDRPSRIPAPPMGQMHVFDDGAYVGINAVDPGEVNVSMVCDPEALRGRAVVDFINDRIGRSPLLSELIEPLPPEAKPGATFPANARVKCAATHDAALVGDASGYVDPLTGEGIYAALWTADELARCAIEGWGNLPAALANYASIRARRQHAKTALCELFQGIIARPWLANSILALLARRQAVADSFIGIVGNSYPPLHGFARIARHALAL